MVAVVVTTRRCVYLRQLQLFYHKWWRGGDADREHLGGGNIPQCWTLEDRHGQRSYIVPVESFQQWLVSYFGDYTVCEVAVQRSVPLLSSLRLNSNPIL